MKILVKSEFPHVESFEAGNKRFIHMITSVVDEANKLGLNGVGLSGVRFLRTTDNARQVDILQVVAEEIPKGMEGGGA